MSTWNGRSIMTEAQDFTMTTDESLRGWEGVCQGKYTRAIWAQEEYISLNINVLELKVARFAVEALTVNQRQPFVHLGMYNRIAVAYLLKMGRLDPLHS